LRAQIEVSILPPRSSRAEILQGERGNEQI
jgi:hypothetical protein